MDLGLRDRILPDTQLRSLEELTTELDMSHGDASAKKSAFWTMLTLSGFIASAGILADSTATVIGAMIIAPLSTPIMGIALGIVTQRRTGATFVALGGALLVVAIGLLFALAVPSSVNLLNINEIAGRTSPGLIDLVAAMATGLAGAIALSRRDVGAVLPGVAIAISLVPPLAVAGVCLGHGQQGLAGGALLLFASNLLALVLCGTLVFAGLGYTTEALGATTRRGRPRRHAYLTLAALIVVIALPLTVNTALHYLLNIWTARVETTAEAWLEDTPGGTVTNVDVVSNEFHIDVRAPGRLPAISDLRAMLADEVPGRFEVVIDHIQGDRIDAGPVG